MITKPAPWEWRPEGVAPDLRSLSRGIIACAPLWRGSFASSPSSDTAAFDYARREVLTNFNGGSFGPFAQGQYGNAIDLTLGNSYLSWPTDILGGRSAFTLTVAIQGPLANSNGSVFSSDWNADSVLLWRNESAARTFRVLLDTSSGTADFTAATAVPANSLNVMSLRYDGATLNQFANGVKDANSASHTGTVDALSGGTYLSGNGPGGASDGTLDAYLYGVIIHDYPLGDDAIRRLHANFFRMFERYDDAPMFAFGLDAATGGDGTDMPWPIFRNPELGRPDVIAY